MRYFWLIFLFFCSCNDYLDVKSDSTLVIPKSLKDIQGLLDDAQRINMSVSYPQYSEQISDDYFVPENTLNTLHDNARELYLWQLFEFREMRDWQSLYSIIYNTNLALELLEKVERTSQNSFDWDRAKGSALFVRSFSFLSLVTLHGHAFDEKTADIHLGIPLRMTSDYNVKSTRATIRECYNRILVDLKEASKLLPITEQVKTRPTKVAALALLARTNLYMGRYSEAGEYAEQALQYHSTLMDFNGDTDILGFNTAYPFRQFNKETIYYATTTTAGGSFNSVDRPVDTILIEAYHLNDLRTKLFFNKNGEFTYFKGGFAGSNVLFCGVSTAELYLTLAESQAFLGNVELSLVNLNTLLKSRWDNTKEFIPITAHSRESALEYIRLERRKELIFRNLRWIDIKRYNREGAGIVLTRYYQDKKYTLKPFDRYYAFPLPQDIIEMTGMPQN